MPRAKPQVEIIMLNGNMLSLKLKPTKGISRHKSSLLQTYTKYKNVVKAGDAKYYAYTTIRGVKVYLGKHATEVAAAIAIAVAEADKDVLDGVHDTEGRLDDVVFVKAKDPKLMSPLHGIDDKEASRLASPVSVPPSPLEPCNIFGAANLKGRLHKSLLQSWQEDHGQPFEPTANASSMRIPHI